MKNKILKIISKLFNTNISYTKKFINKVIEIIFTPEMMFLPGNLAFSFVLSIVPIISIISGIGSVFGVSIVSITEVLGKIFPSIKFDLIIPSIIGQSITIKYISVICIMFFVASNGSNSLIVASNQIYGIKQSGYIKRRSKAILMTLLLCILYIFVLLVPLLGNKIISSFNYFDFKSVLSPILKIVRGPITWLVLYLFIKSLYIIAPDKDVSDKGFNLGALFTTIMWLAATYLYSGWINNFSSYGTYYGSLSNIAILFLWIYWLCYILVIGMCLNVKVENNELEKTGIIRNRK